MAIMNALAELHQEPDLKLNLKFEIEVLCKTLNIDLGVSIYSLPVEIFNFEIDKIMRLVPCMYIWKILHCAYRNWNLAITWKTPLDYRPMNHSCRLWSQWLWYRHLWSPPSLIRPWYWPHQLRRSPLPPLSPRQPQPPPAAPPTCHQGHSLHTRTSTPTTLPLWLIRSW